MRELGRVGVVLLGCAGVAACRGDVLIDKELSGLSQGQQGASVDAGAAEIDGSANGVVEAGGPECPPRLGTPTLLATVAAQGAIVSDGTYVYSAPYGNGPVQRVAIADGATLALNSVAGDTVAIDATHVYSVSSGSTNEPRGLVVDCPKTGCGADYTVLASGQTNVWGVAVDATSVYFTAQGGLAAISKAPLAGGPVTTVVAQGYAIDIAVAGDKLVYASMPNGPGQAVLMNVSVDGGTPQLLFTPQGNGSISSLAVDDSYAYFGTTDGIVGQVPLGGGPAITLATGEGLVTAIAVDGANVYWAGWANETVCATPIGGGAVTVLACGNGPLRGLAVDATNVYFTAGVVSGGDGLFKLAK